ncbi:hypothetical protein HMPREF9370_0561 [Neisseria wadsworthii 9715]|uniref:Uncharacterized protein n=1 Tax=Neisseria wadsworthii 9715 TaxID=1030841 RepID=G4CNA2_9NEIS|nr:hypothetical protein HMPREF9370_0561 [Neisseria wadsworthii 9715]
MFIFGIVCAVSYDKRKLKCKLCKKPSVDLSQWVWILMRNE